MLHKERFLHGYYPAVGDTYSAAILPLCAVCQMETGLLGMPCSGELTPNLVWGWTVRGQEKLELGVAGDLKLQWARCGLPSVPGYLKAQSMEF